MVTEIARDSNVFQRAAAGARAGAALGVVLGAVALAIGLLNGGFLPVGRGVMVPAWWLALGQALGWTTATMLAQALRLETRSRGSRMLGGWAAFLPIGLGFMIPMFAARGGHFVKAVCAAAIFAFFGAVFAAGRPPGGAA